MVNRIWFDKALMVKLDGVHYIRLCLVQALPYNIVASLTLVADCFKLKTEPSELDWLQVYDMTH